MRSGRGYHVVVFGLLVAALGSCTPSSSEGEYAAGSVGVGMLDNFFSRAVTRVPEGAAIRFYNDGRNPHNAVAVDGAWSTETTFGRLAMGPEDETTLRIDRPGVYQFFCTFHGTKEGEGMAATLVVGDVAFAGNRDRDVQATSQASGNTIRVPEDEPTIQKGVDAADPGDLVLVSPGVYEEEVLVQTPSITIRGHERNTVVLDGAQEHSNGIQVVADGVAVENMTAKNYLLNGFFWTGVVGYRGSYLTAFNNADYGIYSFDSIDGVFEHSYASGSPDSGFYIGQCRPCNAVIDDVISENNALGYSGTNAGGNLFIVNSTWRRNLAGIVPNTLDTELLPPQRGAVIAGNLVVDNNNLEAPYKGHGYSAFGNGIVVAGGVGNVVEKNTVSDHQNHGILVTPNLDRNFWISSKNEVKGNLVGGSGRADIAFNGPGGEGNCLSNNDFETSAPFGLQGLYACTGFRLPLGHDISGTMLSLGYVAATPDDSDLLAKVARQPVPGPQESMPGGPEAPMRPAVNVFADRKPDTGSIRRPPPVSAHVSQEVVLSGIPLAAAGPWQLVFGLYGYLLPFVLYAAWTSLAFWDIARRASGTDSAATISRASATGWVIAILVVPFLGAVAYHVAGRSSIPAWLRVLFVGGGLLAYLLIVGVAALAGGVI